MAEKTKNFRNHSPDANLAKTMSLRPCRIVPHTFNDDHDADTEGFAGTDVAHDAAHDDDHD